jgi:hypothetical protein
MSLNQRVTAEFSTCTPSAPPTADLSIQTIRKLGSDWVTTNAFSVSLSIALRRRKSYERLPCGLPAHLVLERRCKAVPRDAVTQAKERTLDSHVQ